MVKSHRIRFTSLMGVVDAPTAADNIITSLRRRAAIVFIPEIFYYVSNLVRVLPAKVGVKRKHYFINPNQILLTLKNVNLYLLHF
jgi:hypothetical protein